MTKKILLVFGTRPEAIEAGTVRLADKQLFAHAAGLPCRPASSMAVQS